jgi:hypothetical protein
VPLATRTCRTSIEDTPALALTRNCWRISSEPLRPLCGVSAARAAPWVLRSQARAAVLGGAASHSPGSRPRPTQRRRRGDRGVGFARMQQPAGLDCGIASACGRPALDLTTDAGQAFDLQTINPAGAATAATPKERSEPMMSWTVVCFCGNVYIAPPDRCEVCGSTVEGVASGGAVTHQHQKALDLHCFAPRRAPLPVPGPPRAELARPDRSDRR